MRIVPDGQTAVAGTKLRFASRAVFPRKKCFYFRHPRGECHVGDGLTVVLACLRAGPRRHRHEAHPEKTNENKNKGPHANTNTTQKNKKTKTRKPENKKTKTQENKQTSNTKQETKQNNKQNERHGASCGPQLKSSCRVVLCKMG